MIFGASAQSRDPHQLYEKHCGSCHAGHAGAFVRDNLDMRAGETVGRKSRLGLASLLGSGHGGLAPDEVAPLIAHLTSIHKSGHLFHDKCIVCHDRAVVFARNRLIVRNGTLTGRYSSRDIERFLSSHGRLTAAEVATMVEVLKRQLNPVKD